MRVPFGTGDFPERGLMTLPERFLDAMRTFDAETMTELLAPDAVIWRNVGNKNRSAQEIIEMLHIERSLIRSSTLEVRQQTTTADGFVVQFVFAGTTAGGADFRIPICIVARIVGDRIAAFDEYSDESSLQPLWQEFLASNQAATEPLA